MVAFAHNGGIILKKENLFLLKMHVCTKLPMIASSYSSMLQKTKETK